jgi:serine/threonine-protein kinase
MIGTAVGPYRILEELGQGGMGTVYLAEIAEFAPGLTRGDQVALKLVHPQLLSTPGFFKRFLREAEVGKRIRHENVVRTFDADATESNGKTALFLVMEYVEGRTLRDLVADLGVVPEALLREIALQVSAGLAAIHDESIVHRDLKPENVLITDDQQVRIMDLGVAKLQEASIAITREGQFAGSFLYAAPEQFKGGDGGPASDLYSLGAMLYELGTGENPFRRDDTAAVIHAQLNVTPPAAIQKNGDLSPFLAEVIRTLLEKATPDRFASAEILGEILSEGEASSWWVEREREIDRLETQSIRIRVRRDTEFVGRAEERRALDEAWDRAREGRSGTLLIEGEAGIGKTRLLDDLVSSIGGEEAHVLYGSYPPTGGLGAISEGVVSKFGSAGLSDALVPYLETTPALVPGFAAMMKHETPPPGAEPITGDVQHTILGNLLRAMAAEKPVLWIVEDLHFATEDSRRLLVSLVRAAEDQRVLLVITARPGEVEQDLALLGRQESFRRVPLGRLSPREVVELAREAFGSESLADRLGAKIAYKSDGVPFFVFEMIRGLKDGPR